MSYIIYASVFFFFYEYNIYFLEYAIYVYTSAIEKHFYQLSFDKIVFFNFTIAKTRERIRGTFKKRDFSLASARTFSQLRTI